jgi:nascent polypeptide-associated complex subunit alpha
MLPGMNMNQIKKLMKDVEEIEAYRVIIEGPRRLVIESPKVMKMSVMGQNTFQIIGEAKEIEEQKELFTEDDIKLVMEQTGADEEDIKGSFIKNNGDIAKTILDLKK